jgi:hypothetical protein
VLDVGVQRFGDPQPVQGEQTSQCVVASPGETGLHEELAELVAI